MVDIDGSSGWELMNDMFLACVPRATMQQKESRGEESK
jgi:hypothetical protein